MRLIAGIDTAMPDVGKKWSYHAEWNQNTRFWREDFQQLAACGFDLLRWQTPWSLVEPRRGEYRWDLIDPKFELATELGVELFYPIAHFSLPEWLAQTGERHAVYSAQLPDRIAEYTDKLLTRYGFRLVIPIVEVQMEAFQRGLAGNWQPHFRNRREYECMRANLVRAFHASAAVAKAHGATVVCSEPATEIETVLELRDAIDIAGIDLYPHMQRGKTILGYFRQWWKAAKRPLCISEFGVPETFNPETKRDHYRKFVDAGIDGHRVVAARMLRDAIQRATSEGIEIPIGGWYPGTGNIGWGQALTKERKKYDCDRAGLVDLTRHSDGTLKRVVCSDLVREVLGLRNVLAQPARGIEMPVQPTPVSVPLDSVQEQQQISA